MSPIGLATGGIGSSIAIMICFIREHIVRRFFLFIILMGVVNTLYAYETQLTVAQDGSGDFTSIQSALNATKAYPWTDITIHVKNGVYHEKVNVYAWNTRIHLSGESREHTVISFDDYFDKINLGRNSTFHTFTMRVAGNDFTASNLTIRNTAGPVGQAVALHVEADRAAFYNVNIEGYQDTLYVAGEGHRTYFNNSMISGSVDFIFGDGTAVFDHCEIRSLLSDTYITAASTPNDQPYGLVFLDSHFTASEGVNNVYLGRPWRQYAATTILRSRLDKHIHPAGWHNWNDADKEKSSRYQVFENRGQGAESDKRVNWQHRLTEKQADQFKPSVILGNWSLKKPI